jgi:flavin reductase (DIM6/NTAB) family NADH-FMN oxidoreductase RutF
VNDPGAFDAIMAQVDPPLVVVTTTNGRERAGCVVGFHAQSGIEPHSLSVWLSKANHTFRVATTADLFAVHFLTAADRESAELFGTNTGDEVDKFERCRWEPGPDGVPLLDDCPNRVVGRKIAVLDTGDDHVCLVLHPVDASYAGEFTPLCVSDVSDLDAGHEAEERPEPTDARAAGGDAS